MVRQHGWQLPAHTFQVKDSAYLKQIRNSCFSGSKVQLRLLWCSLGYPLVAEVPYRDSDIIYFTPNKPEPTPIQGNWSEQHRLGKALLSYTYCQDPYRGSSIHARLVKAPLEWCGPFSLWNKLLNMYARSACYTCMFRLFYEMQKRDTASYNIVVSECLHDKCTDLFKLFSLYHKMLYDRVLPNHITLSILLKAIGIRVSSLSAVEQMHGHVLKLSLGKNGHVGGSLVNLYTRYGKLELAALAFEEIDQLDAVSWNIMIDACAQSGSTKHTVSLFSRMRHEGSSNIGFDFFSLTSVLKTCLEPRYLDLGKQLHSCVLKAGIECDLPVANALVTMYSKCEARMESAAKAFSLVRDPNIITWTAIISGFSLNELYEDAFRVYVDMLRTGLRENEYTFSSVLPVIGNIASIEHARQLHTRIVKSPFSSDIGVANALIDMYFKCGSIENAQLAFRTMTNHDHVSWTVMIVGYGHHGKAGEAVEIFKRMESGGFQPDTIAFLSVLVACSHGGLVDEGLRIFHSMSAYDIKPNRKHYACVIDLLGRARRFKEAEKFITDMGIELDSLAWESLLGTCEIHGEIEVGKKSAEKIIASQPNKDGPYVSLANIFAEKRMWAEKIELRQRLEQFGSKKDVARSWSTNIRNYLLKDS